MLRSIRKVKSFLQHVLFCHVYHCCMYFIFDDRLAQRGCTRTIFHVFERKSADAKYLFSYTKCSILFYHFLILSYPPFRLSYPNTFCYSILFYSILFYSTYLMRITETIQIPHPYPLLLHPLPSPLLVDLIRGRVESGEEATIAGRLLFKVLIFSKLQRQNCSTGTRL